MRTRSVVVYSALRLLAFAVPFGVLMLFPVFRELYWLAAIFAAFIGLALSMLFLRRPLDEVTTGIAARRAQRRAETPDDVAEDDLAAETVDRRDAGSDQR